MKRRNTTLLSLERAIRHARILGKPTATSEVLLSLIRAKLYLTARQ